MNASPIISPMSGLKARRYRLISAGLTAATSHGTLTCTLSTLTTRSDCANNTESKFAERTADRRPR